MTGTLVKRGAFGQTWQDDGQDAATHEEPPDAGREARRGPLASAFRGLGPADAFVSDSQPPEL